jgi:hypothetical protein
VARVSVASVCRSTASSFSVADFCSSALLIHASCCQLSRVLISYGGSSLSRDRCFSSGSFSCVTNWTPSEGLQFSSAVFHFQAPHSSCLALGLGILFSWFPPGSVISGTIKPCSPRVSSAMRRAPKLFPPLIHRVRFFFSLEVPAAELIFWLWI